MHTKLSVEYNQEIPHGHSKNQQARHYKVMDRVLVEAVASRQHVIFHMQHQEIYIYSI